MAKSSGAPENGIADLLTQHAGKFSMKQLKVVNEHIIAKLSNENLEALVRKEYVYVGEHIRTDTHTFSALKYFRDNLIVILAQNSKVRNKGKVYYNILAYQKEGCFSKKQMEIAKEHGIDLNNPGNIIQNNNNNNNRDNSKSIGEQNKEEQSKDNTPG